jgi:hypothetical protein
MDLAHAIDALNQNAVAIQALATVSGEQARWKPSPDDWSILEIINHLADEEREDFRQRLDYTLHRPGEAWPPIDPAGWVVSRDYNARDPDESLADFLVERGASLAWLRRLATPDWSQAYHHPAAGRMTAGDLLASWVAHDGLHIRQLAEVRRAYLQVVYPGALIEYAGDW